MSKVEKWVLGIYAAWTGAVVLICLLRDGLSPDNITRLLIVAFLLLNLAWYRFTNSSEHPGRMSSFVIHCSLGALVVEGCYMISRPVFACLRVDANTSFATAVRSTLTDFAFTLPFYLLLFSLFWFLINRFSYKISEFILVFSLAQSLGDGNAFFIANPAMLLFAPYVMLNYQAIIITPWLRARPHLPTRRQGGLSQRVLRLLLPLVLVPAVYWLGGAAIIIVGRQFGLSSERPSQNG